MQKKESVLNDNPAAPALQPEMLNTLKKEDMQQAVVERFKVGSDAASRNTTKKR